MKMSIWYFLFAVALVAIGVVGGDGNTVNAGVMFMLFGSVWQKIEELERRK